MLALQLLKLYLLIKEEICHNKNYVEKLILKYGKRMYKENNNKRSSCSIDIKKLRSKEYNIEDI